MAYTGYTLEQQDMAAVDQHISQLLSKLDVLIDGPFILEERDLTLQFGEVEIRDISKWIRDNATVIFK